MDNTYKLLNSETLGKSVIDAAAVWHTWQHRYKTRKQLHTLVLNDLNRVHYDLGLSTADALGEINKPFWRR